MTKTEALKRFGHDVVEKARDIYETDFGKVLFVEDCKYEDDCPASEEEQLDRLGVAQIFIENLNRTNMWKGCRSLMEEANKKKLKFHSVPNSSNS